jgi:hypothetical protein
MRAVVLVVAIALGPIVVHDSLVPREREWSTGAALTAIHGYQRFISPWLGVRCRFKPSCSHYGYESIRKHGVIVGSVKTAWRILRCNPFTKFGTEDPP